MYFFVSAANFVIILNVNNQPVMMYLSCVTEVEDLPAAIQEQLYEELLDRDAQAQLECDPPALNWSLEVTVRLGSRLFALWNRSAGDCLLDSAMQASWGVFDRDNTLRRALAESLHQVHFTQWLDLQSIHGAYFLQGSHLFYPRWKEYESLQASLMHFSLDEGQWEEDWAGLLSLASQPGSSLEQLHVFALAHVLRRPIIVYGVKYVKSFRGETLGYARFEGGCWLLIPVAQVLILVLTGVYLPLLWESTFCCKSPLALGYTRGHFSALVPIEPYVNPPPAPSSRPSLPGADDDLQVTFLPLHNHDRKLLPVHFLTQAEVSFATVYLSYLIY
jgi:ubiquitin thioesterase ZRANB1